MTILGISGFEDLVPADPRAPLLGRRATVQELLTCTPQRIPLQYFPLQLIGHDGAAALTIDGRLTAFVSEERVSRVKHGFNLAGRTGLPRQAIRCCLGQARLSFQEIDCVAHYCRFSQEGLARRLAAVSRHLPESERGRLGREYAASYENRARPETIRAQLARIAGAPLPEERVLCVPHHLAHAAGAFYSSDFPEALIVTVDGYGEEESVTWSTGNDGGIQLQGSIPLPTSLGVLYQVITAYLGFRSFGDEYKVMGLAAYGDPAPFRARFGEILQLNSDGCFSTPGLATSDLLPRLREAFGAVEPLGDYSVKAADIAAGLQEALERALLNLLAALRRRYDLPYLCLSGGVALNACANGRIRRARLFDRIFIQPAAGDDGAALGAALCAQRDLLRGDRPESIRHVYWGSSFDGPAIESALRRSPVRWRRAADVAAEAAELLAAGKTLGWFQGRMEMGPRALGARSILADARSTALRDRLNATVKRRESFRPFAPVVRHEDASLFFELEAGETSPFMLVTFPTRSEWRAVIAGTVHVDGSARIQTLSREDNPRFHDLLTRFGQITGVPALLNTSFNRAGEPIVHRPEEAIACFLAGGLDALALEDYLVFPLESAG
jgi:carbamoyltransferase